MKRILILLIILVCLSGCSIMKKRMMKRMEKMPDEEKMEMMARMMSKSDSTSCNRSFANRGLRCPDNRSFRRHLWYRANFNTGNSNNFHGIGISFCFQGWTFQYWSRGSIINWRIHCCDSRDIFQWSPNIHPFTVSPTCRGRRRSVVGIYSSGFKGETWST